MIHKNKTDKKILSHPKLAVGAVVFKDQKVLLIKRGKAPSKGMWSIPGGSVELGETLKQAAERELFEETAIRIEAGDPVYAFESIERDEIGSVLFHYYVVDLEATYLNGEPSPGDDAVDSAWVSAEDLNRYNVHKRTKELLRQQYGFG